MHPGKTVLTCLKQKYVRFALSTCTAHVPRRNHILRTEQSATSLHSVGTRSEQNHTCKQEDGKMGKARCNMSRHPKGWKPTRAHIIQAYLSSSQCMPWFGQQISDIGGLGCEILLFHAFTEASSLRVSKVGCHPRSTRRCSFGNSMALMAIHSSRGVNSTDSSRYNRPISSVSRHHSS